MNPDVLLMDEPCSALDPTSTRRIEDTIAMLRDAGDDRHRHPQHAAGRPSLAAVRVLPGRAGHAGQIVEVGATKDMFERPSDPRTSDYVNGRFG